MGGKHTHNCTIPAPPNSYPYSNGGHAQLSFNLVSTAVDDLQQVQLEGLQPRTSRVQHGHPKPLSHTESSNYWSYTSFGLFNNLNKGFSDHCTCTCLVPAMRKGVRTPSTKTMFLPACFGVAPKNIQKLGPEEYRVSQ